MKKLFVAGLIGLFACVPVKATDILTSNITHGIVRVLGNAAQSNAVSSAYVLMRYHDEVAVSVRYKMDTVGAFSGTNTFTIKVGKTPTNMFNYCTFTSISSGTSFVDAGTNLYIGAWPVVGLGSVLNNHSNTVVLTNLEVTFQMKSDRNGYNRPD